MEENYLNINRASHMGKSHVSRSDMHIGNLAMASALSTEARQCLSFLDNRLLVGKKLLTITTCLSLHSQLKHSG